MSEPAGAAVSEVAVPDAYRTASSGLRHCLALADQALERGNARRAAEYLLGALDDLEPELRVLAAALGGPAACLALLVG